jgi:hypothetical protein
MNMPNDLVVWVDKGFIVHEKNIQINSPIAAPYMAKKKARKLEVVTLKS